MTSTATKPTVLLWLFFVLSQLFVMANHGCAQDLDPSHNCKTVQPKVQECTIAQKTFTCYDLSQPGKTVTVCFAKD